MNSTMNSNFRILGFLFDFSRHFYLNLVVVADLRLLDSEFPWSFNVGCGSKEDVLSPRVRRIQADSRILDWPRSRPGTRGFGIGASVLSVGEVLPIFR
ncbi:hypothetical protein RchiOBHm_Chr2g0119071 [Rosa chinensis]|uniref:Uncharacterized protein n=1 Tax=Rosa chinensis TaxID=74649 RepID=A0A2P6RRX2_ROSCH|nr:hypothetical protein RchiOBHm_Chr2g0119071 [Rosa chinensis]